MDGTQGCLEYSLYFDEYGDVHSDYSKMFISIFDGWLGKGNLGQLDTVTELEWKKFSHFLEILFEQYELFSVLGEYKNINPISDIKEHITTLENSNDIESQDFLKIIIPEIECVVAESWDYTWILFFKDKASIIEIEKMIAQVGLYHFTDK